MKLIPLSDFVLEQKDTSTIDTAQIDWYDKEISKLELIRSYTKFLKQPLTLGMFVPCDIEGNVLEHPAGFEDYLGNEDSLLYAKDYEYIHEYARAKEKILFEGWEINSDEKEIVCNYNSYYLDFSDGYGIIFQEVRGDDYDYTECFEKIEELSMSQFDFQLTPSALDAIGIKE